MRESRLEGLPSRRLAGGRRVAEARTGVARALGLAALDDLPAQQALRIAPCRSVHTFGMRFDLDLVWLDAHERVVRVDRGVPPRRLRVCLRARSVVECRAGQADAFIAAGL